MFVKGQNIPKPCLKFEEANFPGIMQHSCTCVCKIVLNVHVHICMFSLIYFVYSYVMLLLCTNVHVHVCIVYYTLVNNFLCIALEYMYDVMKGQGFVEPTPIQAQVFMYDVTISLKL